MQFAGSPLFLWVDGQMVNMSLCQGVCYFYDEEDGWVVSFNMIDEFIFSQHGSEEEAKQALLAVHAALFERGYVVKVESPVKPESAYVNTSLLSNIHAHTLSEPPPEEAAPAESAPAESTFTEHLPPPPPIEPEREEARPSQ
jgi:hypothetical protein